MQRAHESRVGGLVVAAREAIGEGMDGAPVDLRQAVEHGAQRSVERDGVAVDNRNASRTEPRACAAASSITSGGVAA